MFCITFAFLIFKIYLIYFGKTKPNSLMTIIYVKMPKAKIQQCRQRHDATHKGSISSFD